MTEQKSGCRSDYCSVPLKQMSRVSRRQRCEVARPSSDLRGPNRGSLTQSLSEATWKARPLHVNKVPVTFWDHFRWRAWAPRSVCYYINYNFLYFWDSAKPCLVSKFSRGWMYAWINMNNKAKKPRMLVFFGLAPSASGCKTTVSTTLLPLNCLKLFWFIFDVHTQRKKGKLPLCTPSQKSLFITLLTKFRSVDFPQVKKKQKLRWSSMTFITTYK